MASNPDSVMSQPMEQERLVGAIAQRVRHTLNLNDLVTLAAQELGKLLLVDRVEIVKYVPQQNLWRHLAEYCGDGDCDSFLKTDIPDHNNPLAERLKQFEVVHIDNANPVLLEDEINREFAQLFPGSWLLLPLKIGETLWGSLSLLQKQGGGWQPSQVKLIQAAADQLMIAIEHSQLYQQVQRLNEELEHTVKQRTAELSQALASESMLKRITDRVRDSLDESHILETVVEELVNLLELDHCDTGLYNANRNVCTIAYDYGTMLPSTRGKAIDMTTTYPAVYDQLLCCQHVQFCRLTSEAQPVKQTILACPIFDNQGVLGDLWLFRSSNHLFNDSEVRLVQQITNQCAIAIRQARLYQASQQQVENLEHLNLLKDNFLSTISHELRTPMSTMKMAIQMLTLALGREGVLLDPSKPSPNPNKIAHYLKILNDECNREIALITDLLDLQQLEAGTHSLTVQPIDPVSYLHRILLPFQEQVAQHQQTLAIDIPPTLPPILSDSQSLERILVELLTNACKYTPAEENILVAAKVISNFDAANQPIRVSKRASSHTFPHVLSISVINTGIEIPPDQLGRIFEKFYRIPNSDPHRHSGTGLGLALVKKLVLQIGGRIFAESGDGRTCFTVELPGNLG
ncbi:MAG: ATP-binding protein [Leptolyngbyaceae cyanobacterium bins.302]|nr:ATP-binding protein [Leptolyngbyaceae cyanobacterium bins.302]